MHQLTPVQNESMGAMVVKDTVVQVVKLSEKPMKRDAPCALGVVVSAMNHWQQTKHRLVSGLLWFGREGRIIWGSAKLLSLCRMSSFHLVVTA